MAEITNKLLKQAIADAEAVRETAVANAKLVLEEAITPQIREMIARRLRVEAMEGAEEEEEELKKEAAKEQPFQDAEAEGSSEMPAASSTIGTKDNKEPSDASHDGSGIGDGGENKEDSHTGWYDDWSESDFDLDEVIKELEEDIAALSEAEHEEEEEEEEEEEGVKPHMKDETWKGKDEVSQETYAADVSKYAKAPVVEDDMEPKKDMEAEKDKDEEEIDLEEILAELEADDDAEGHTDGMEKTKEMAAHLAGLKKELAQYREAVDILRGRLNEVNLLNAKLLFTNKMFRNQGLTNEQKVRIVESFDRATTVREVKLVYAALVENLSTQAKTLNATRKKIVAEGFASKATPTTAPKKDVIVENTVAKRLQQLAGIL